MVKGKSHSVLIITALVVLQLGQFCYFLNNQQQKPKTLAPKETKAIMHRAYFMNQNFYDEAYEQGSSQAKEPGTRVHGAILPHHLIVKDKIAAFLSGIEKNNYETVVMIGPNHFERGASNIIFSRAKWQTPYGELLPNGKLAYNLIEAGFIPDEDPFAGEHAISGLVGFVKKSFPQAKFLSIIIRPTAKTEELDRLIEVIAKSVDPEKALLLASVDFSHYLNVAESDKNDEISKMAIESGEVEKILAIPVDSPKAIYVLMSYLKQIGAEKSNLIFHTNSGRLIGQMEAETTSHMFFYFSREKF